MKSSVRKIELLAPARDANVAIEAIKHGADAVYMGASKFGARSAAGNEIEDIAKEFNAPLINIEGDVDRSVMNDLEALADNLKETIYDELASELRMRGV